MTFMARRTEAQIAWLLAQLTAALDDTGPSGEDQPSQAVYPDQAVAALDAILRLRTLDPVAAFHRLEALERVVDRVESRWGSPGTDRTLLKEVAGLFPAFYRALIPGDPAGLAERVFRAVAGTQVVQRGLPADLLAALGRGGREDLVLRIARYRAGPGRWDARCVSASYMTAVLLAEPDSEHLTRTVLEHGLEHLIFPGEVAERLVVEGRADLQPGFWLELALGRMENDGNDGDDEDSAECSREALVERCLAHCEARGLPELAQEVRWCAFEAFFTVERLRAWLDGVLPGQRAAEEARVLREIVADEDGNGSSALQLLVAWPDLTAAAALVRRGGDLLSYAGHEVYDPWAIAARLEADAPDAALLLYRAIVMWPYDPSRVDPDWLLDRCAALWARAPDGPYESHARFLDRVEEKRRRNLASGRE